MNEDTVTAMREWTGYQWPNPDEARWYIERESNRRRND